MTLPDDQTRRLLAGLDLADQGQLIDIDRRHGVGARQGDEGRFAILAEPNVRAALPDIHSLI